MTRKQKIIIASSVFVAAIWGLLYLVLIPLFPVIPDYYFFQQKETFDQNQIPLLIHIFFGATALITGSINIVRGFRRQTDKKHRILGRIYGFSVLSSALAGLYIAQDAYGGVISELGFTTLAIIWLFTLGLSIYNIAFKKNIANHAFWMIINFSLTFAAVTLRIQLVPFTFPPGSFAIAYPIIAWTCWVPNLIVGYFIARREKSKLLNELIK